MTVAMPVFVVIAATSPVRRGEAVCVPVMFAIVGGPPPMIVESLTVNHCMPSDV